ncbi:MAG: Methyltransferase protein [Candidatus Parcubacteria bacterium]|nr:Methyltransferase protein [Candidatus Parcubacteria bacterium]
MIVFPEKKDYPDSFSILDNPEKDVKKYLRMVVSSAFAYFDADPVTKYLFRKRFYIIDSFLKKVGMSKVKSALDVGTGVGYFVPALASYADKVVALDYSDDILEYVAVMAKNRGLANVTTLRGDILKMPFPDNTFNLVICMSVLEHFKDLRDPLLELKRVLAPGGILVTGYPSETAFFRFLHQKVIAWTTKKGKKAREYLNKNEESDDTAMHAPHVSNAEDIQGAVEAAGLQEVTSKAIKLLPPFLELYRINFLRKP